MSEWRRARSQGYLVLALVLSGCAVGPNFHRPAPPDTPGFQPADDGGTNSEVQPAEPKLVPTTVIDFDWWKSFRCPALDALIARALANSPQIEGAQARLRQAQAQLRASYGAFYPAVGASFDATRQEYSPSRVGQEGAGSVFSLFSPAIAVNYLLDIFGGNRRTVEGMKARAEQQQQIERGTYLTLAATVATTAIARAQFHEQADAATGLVTAEQAQVEAMAARVSAGTAPTSNLLALQVQLENSRVALASVRQKANQADDLLAILLGEPPASANLPDIRLADIHLPESLPLTLPSALVRQRPDILAAEATAHAASADVGVATAALLPQITLTAGMGSSANSVGNIFSAGTGVWSYGVGVAQPIFEGGALLNQRTAAKEGYRAAMADYRQTVLVAFGQVGDALAALKNDSDAAAADVRADDAAETMLHLATVDHSSGLTSDADLEASIVPRLQARMNRLNSEAVQMQDCVALFQALGGGWMGSSS